ncbi:membrane protein [Streptomyces mexicanus]
MVASVLDQAASSLTNIAVLVIAARVSTVHGFATFSMVYLTFTVLLGVNMAYVGQAVVLTRGGAAATGAACRSAVSFTALAATGVGALLAAVGAVTAAVTGGWAGPGGAFLALGLVLPLVLVQDGLRYAFSTLRRPGLALAADTLRLVCVVPALLLQPRHSAPGLLVAVWGVSAVPALLLGLRLLWPHVRGIRADLRPYVRRGHLGQRFVVEFAVGNASSQLAVLGLGLFAAPLAVGALRGATTLFGPLNVLFNSVNAFGPPLLGRLGGRRAVARAAAVLGLVLCAVGLAWGLVLHALPARAGHQLLGATWQSAAALLPASGAQYAVMGLGTCALVTLRVLSPRATLPVQVVFSLVSVVLMLGGYLLSGSALGAAWGLAAGSALKAVAAWTRVARLPAHEPSSAAAPVPAVGAP